jgi:hypothetical protein
VRFDLPRLGDISELVGIHLQCHIGTDTLSLARLGARMTGLDFSAPALAVARNLAADCGQLSTTSRPNCTRQWQPSAQGGSISSTRGPEPCAGCPRFDDGHRP